MSETFEKIRSGEFIGQSEESKETNVEDNSIQLQRQMSDKLSQSIEDPEYKFPDFVSIVTQTEKLSNDVAEGYYNASVPEKPEL